MSVKPRRKIYVCVYRRHIPSSSAWVATNIAAEKNSLLKMFLDDYLGKDSYFDWGDDPGFYSALALHGDARVASWSICRPDVRNDIEIGDAVVYFICRPHFVLNDKIPIATGPIDYFYIGCGTVAHKVSRSQIWDIPQLSPYREFLNALARPDGDLLTNIEPFVPPHEDWEKRAGIPVIIFDQQRTYFELRKPHHVAQVADQLIFPEQWFDDHVSERIYSLLFDKTERSLRTSNTGFQHAKRTMTLKGSKQRKIVDELLELATPAECQSTP